MLITSLFHYLINSMFCTFHFKTVKQCNTALKNKYKILFIYEDELTMMGSSTHPVSKQNPPGGLYPL